MRWLIEEQLDMHYNDIKSYIFNIKDFNHKELYEEWIKQYRALNNYSPDDTTKEDVISMPKLDLITKAVEEKFYLFYYENDHLHNKKVVENIINDLPIFFANTKYEA